ncbi:helicase C-terminal domain-containing protein [Parachlamydia sp. AcF125]|uniref:ATP-dependent DNA helicase n=1 Tax=Parachlamydia sp. AcF125 TaxID=2795736 RepID=UPI001BC996B6|nr:helicase C-terminal domain-containing protein [Parachlamydia sp. AcF125]MBS4167545.1 putative ATP-dependent helicase DinG [Parachlamydia sp. AcF125]
MSSRRLDIEQALSLFKNEGLLARSVKGFEVREPQIKMMEKILHAYNHGEITLIEAGTGTGKSMAYLIPAILWSLQNKERTLISTHTITLQEQLLLKDIPALAKALGVEIHAVLVKGMSNYLCLRKLEEACQEFRLLPDQESQELAQIEAWAEQTTDGSRSSLHFVPSATTWEKVCAESDTCNHMACPHYKNCHFIKARREANEAQLLIANHNMLFADLLFRSENEHFEDPALLPPYHRIIIDEAHHIEDIATDFFATRISQIGIMRVLARLTAEKQGKVHGKLPLLKEKIQECCKKNATHEVNSLLNRLQIDLPALRKDLLKYIVDAFHIFGSFVQILQSSPPSADEEWKENKLRLLPFHLTHPDWHQKILPHVKLTLEEAQRYITALSSLEMDLKALDNDQLNEQTKGIRFDIAALSQRLSLFAKALETFISAEFSPSKVRWIEIQATKAVPSIQLVHADLDISQALVDFLFTPFSTIVLCSATLTTNNRFDFIRKRLGLTAETLSSRAIKEEIYDSPFNYREQAMLLVPRDLPEPSHPKYQEQACEKIWQALQSSRGNAFVLFTSYTHLKACFHSLQKRLENSRFHLFKQGDDNRQSLLQKFKAADRAVLFGTDSFWEGVDVMGEDLRCVIIVKLPFRVPNEPLIQARAEAITARGGDPFGEYALPQAIMKFKQGFGRLIRDKNDRGCVVCLDSRLVSKSYGSSFLNSLPPCQVLLPPSEHVQAKLDEFYKKTYHFVKNKTPQVV